MGSSPSIRLVRLAAERSSGIESGCRRMLLTPVFTCAAWPPVCYVGGLARATGDAVVVLDAAGKDVVLIETVGVGQGEVDVARTADVSIVVTMPGTGDDVQALKAGIMEIADVFVVNKSDREGRTEPWPTSRRCLGSASEQIRRGARRL